MTSVVLTVEDGLATLVLSGPGRKNALTWQAIGELERTFGRLRDDPQVNAVLLTGAGDDFCSGGDISMMGSSTDASVLNEVMASANRLVSTLLNFDRPVIAAVDGVAFGAGFSLALACDFLIASDRARLCMSFARIGAMVDLGATYTLPRIVGYQKAKEIIYSAREVAAHEALALGIALEIHPPERLAARAEELARSLANMSPVAFALTKRLLGRTFESNLAAQLEAEGSAQAVAMNDQYFTDAIERFMRKEPSLYRWPTLK
ncbi:enoyl-CoA hydratase/isomerase family protein [Pseudomonas sp. JQ170]|uniref:enoyl-CoA hydratase/isomerase family protein n=1 Tax=unclassified Pseudomonas TaxID=196821 RepID=UPI0026502EDC|nr:MULTISPECIES: enoyl-CoA hydratase/isomerase family protein [unclassified Pseudomonas]MDN7139869.1 enoyl-CoA hydratase/isomerase family protein [Pseudomonas sp. JQ170]WRO73677.1 enoyl-CoA hydratase/isomerase family protein [Pseudomonas sp. 170C]